MSAPTASRANLLIPGVIALALIVALGIAIPSDTSASDKFSDVPDSMIFHKEVRAIADAGITTGCGGGKYCPWEPVSRLAMAAFMNRGLSRIGMRGSNAVPNSPFNNSDGTIVVGSVEIKVPGAGSSATQFVEVRGQVNVLDWIGGPSTCPCEIEAQLWEWSDSSAFPNWSYANVPYKGSATAATSWVFDATPGIHSYYMTLRSSSETDLLLNNIVLTATTYPFGAHGGNSLSSAPGAQPTSVDAAAVPRGLHYEDALEAMDSSR